jgi:transposase-like protein
MPAQTAQLHRKLCKRFPAHVKKRILKQVLEDGEKVSEVCQENGISRKTFYAWKKVWEKAYGRGKRSALQLKYKRGDSHPRNNRRKFVKDVLRLVVTHPEWGSRRLSRALHSEGKKLGSNAVHKLLVEIDLSRFEQREEFSRLHQTLRGAEEVLERRVNRLLPFNRKRLVEAVLLEGRSVREACKEFRVSRKTFYIWKRRYEQARAREETILTLLEDRYASGFEHPRAIPKQLVQRVLDLVAVEPELSVHRLDIKIPSVGHHGIQNILERFSLNTFEKRLAYAQVRLRDASARQAQKVQPVTGWVDRVKQVFEQFLPSRAPAPPPGLRPSGPVAPFFKQLRRLSPLIFLSIFILLLP